MAQLRVYNFSGPDITVDVEAGTPILLWDRFQYSERKVEDVTPSGLIRVAGKLFKANGDERTTSYHRWSIRPFDAKVLSDQAQESADRDVRNFARHYEYRQLPIEVIRAVCVILREHDARNSTPVAQS